MPITNLKEEVLYTYVPPNSLPVFKLEIIRDDGTVDDVTANINSFKVTDMVTESIGSFEFELNNPNNQYTGLYNGNEVVKYYKDYAATASTLRFRGRTEKISSQGYLVKIEGRSESLKFLNVTVNETFTAIDTGVILQSLITNYASGFTAVNVSTSGTVLTVNWSQKPFWDCVKDLCNAAGFDCYVDKDLDFHYNLSGSVSNAFEAVVHGLNLYSTDDFTPDISEVKNRIIVYGAEQQGVQLIYTAEDSTSQGAYGVKEEVIKDDNITDYNQAVEVGEFELANKKDPPVYGEVTSVLLSTIQPGERVYISDPDNGLDPGLYLTGGYEDSINWDNGEYQTKVFIAKEPRKISHIMRDRVQNENLSKGTSINPYGLRQSYVFLFDSDSGTHTNTSISSGYLIPSAIGGNWVSDARSLASNISEAYLVLVGDQLDQVTVQVSGNGGVTYQTITNRGRITMTTALGVSLQVKVTFNATAARVDSLSLMYNVS